MNTVRYWLALLLVSLCIVGTAAESNEIYVGVISEISKDSLELQDVPGTLSIGFVSTKQARHSLRRMKVGDRAYAVFGSAREAGTGQLINKLVAIRLCRERDRECDAARKDALADYEKRAAVSRAKYDLCAQAMQRTLAQDARYVAPQEGGEPRGVQHPIYSLRGDQKVCADRLRYQHVAAVNSACELHRCGDDVGGGCAHISGRSLNWSLSEKAYATCSNP